MIKQIPNYIFHLVVGNQTKLSSSYTTSTAFLQAKIRSFEVRSWTAAPLPVVHAMLLVALRLQPKKVVVTSIHWNSFLLIWANSYYSIPKPVFFGYFGEASPTQKKPFGGDQPAENGRWNLPRVMVQKVCKPNSEAWFNLLFYKHYFWWLVRRSSSLGV